MAINREYAESLGLSLESREEVLLAENADGTPNAAGPITHQTMLILELGGWHHEALTLVVGKFMKPYMYLGDDWLQKHNPRIDWVECSVELKQGPPQTTRIRAVQTLPVKNPPPDYVREFPQVFREEMFDRLPPDCNAANHAIELLPGAMPFWSKIYALP